MCVYLRFDFVFKCYFLIEEMDWLKINGDFLILSLGLGKENLFIELFVLCVMMF